MGGFDAGALLFKVQAVGAAIFKRDLNQVDQAMEGVEKTARKAAASSEALGASQDNVGKKAKSAKQGLDQQKQSSEALAKEISRLENELKAQGTATETAAQKLRRLKEEQAEQKRAAAEAAAASRELGKALLVAGAAAAALVTLSVAKYVEFDQAMSNVRAATMASIDDQKRLGEAALEAGADTAYSAKEAAAAEEELAKAGLSVDAIVGGSLNGSLALAAAGQLQVARSAEIMATSLTQFKLPAEQATHVADVLAAGAGKAQGGVEDMALALSYVGPVSAGLKISLEETAGAIAFLASQGILGEKAGTSLRGVIMSLTAPSQIASKTMSQYGIDIWDSAGNMKSLAAVSQMLRDKLGGLTEAERSAALGRIFGNEQITAARILYDGGAQKITEWTDAVNDSGYAADQAAMRQDNLAGDIEKLGGAFDTALIRTGAGANDVLRNMVQIVTALVDWYGELPAPVQSTALMLGVATAAVTLLAGAALVLKARFFELRQTFKAADASMKTTALTAGAVGIALTGVLAVVGMLAVAHADARARAESYADALKQGGDAAEEEARRIAAANLQTRDSFLWMEGDSAFDAAKKLGVSLELVTDAALGNAEAQKQLNAELDLGANGSERQKQRLKETGLSLTDYAIASETVKDAITRENDARGRGIELNRQEKDAKAEGADASKTAADAYLEEAGAAEELEDQLKKLIDTMMEANGENQDAVSSNAKWRKALGDIKDEVEDQKKAYKEAKGSLSGFKLSLNESTEAGSANAAMLADVAGAAQKAAEDQFKVDMATMSADDATKKYVSRLESQRKAFIDSAVEAGFNRKAVEKLADKVFALPDEKSIKILADTADAQGSIDGLIYRNANRTISVRIAAGAGGQGGITQADGGHVKFYSQGGENHEAQYAQPGDWRIWAEPETGGEWYLPDSPAKRGRSLSLAKEMLDGWGYELTPKGAQRFARGGKVSSTVKEMRADWATSQRRGENRYAGMNGQGLSLVDEAFEVAAQSSKKAAAKIRKEALRAEKQYLRLEKAAEEAEKKLDKAKDRLSELKDTVAGLAAGFASSIRRAFDVSQWKSTTKTEQVVKTRNVDGVQVTTATTKEVTKPLTAKQIRADAKRRAKQIQNFAKLLSKLEKKGYNAGLIAEIAELGVEEGTPIARALLDATKAEMKDINAAYKDANKYANQAGKQVATIQVDPETKQTYKTLIEKAQKQVDEAKKNKDSINRQLRNQTDRIIGVISRGLANAKGHATGGRVTGPGTTTSDSILRRLSNEEHVVTAAEVSGAGGHEVIEAQRELWRRGIAGLSVSAPRVANYPISSTSNTPTAAPVNITVAPTFVNPINVDTERDAWKTGLIAGAMTLRGDL